MLLAMHVLMHVAPAASTPTTFSTPITIGGAVSDWPSPPPGVELEVFNHTVSAANVEYGAYLNHFWSAGGKGAVGQYIADRQVIRYYIDGETTPSIEMEPAMACGSGMGWEGLEYYEAGLHEKEPWGSGASTTMFGHSAATGGGWHNRHKIPFAKSVRVTVQLPKHGSAELAANTTTKLFLIFRGVEGDRRPLKVGDIALPHPHPAWQLRLRKLQTRANRVRPFSYVSLANWSSTTSGAASGGALLWTLFSLNPYGGAMEGCIRAYTSDVGARAAFPGLLLSTGTEDYYDSAYYFSHFEKLIFDEDAGLSHKSLGGRQKLASMYRFHHNDPLYFTRRLNLLWRDGEELVTMPDGSHARKCVLNNAAPAPNTTIGGETVDLTVDAWIYTWEEPGAPAAAMGEPGLTHDDV